MIRVCELSDGQKGVIGDAATATIGIHGRVSELFRIKITAELQRSVLLRRIPAQRLRCSVNTDSSHQFFWRLASA